MTRTPEELSHRIHIISGLVLIALAVPFLGPMAGLGVFAPPGATGRGLAFLLAAVGVLMIQPGVWRWRAARVVARRYGDQDIAVVCRVPGDPFLVRLLVVHPTDGLHLLMLDGSPLARWSWGDVGVADVRRVRMLARLWTALVVDVDGEERRFVLLGPSGLTAPLPLADRVRELIAARASAA